MRITFISRQKINKQVKNKIRAKNKEKQNGVNLCTTRLLVSQESLL